eukprot:1436074-Rhodomonas_salina.3
MQGAACLNHGYKHNRKDCCIHNFSKERSQEMPRCGLAQTQSLLSRLTTFLQNLFAFYSAGTDVLQSKVSLLELLASAGIRVLSHLARGGSPPLLLARFPPPGVMPASPQSSGAPRRYCSARARGERGSQQGGPSERFCLQ